MDQTSEETARMEYGPQVGELICEEKRLFPILLEWRRKEVVWISVLLQGMKAESWHIY